MWITCGKLYTHKVLKNKAFLCQEKCLLVLSIVYKRQECIFNKG